MTHRLITRRILLAHGVIALLAMVVRAQPPRDVVDIDYEKHKFLGTANCENCHEKMQPRYEGFGYDILFTEWKTWRDEDKHSEAYKVLLDARGQRMAKLLNKDVLLAETGCVQCHTSNAVDSRWATLPPQKSPDLDLSVGPAEGVGCEACHGPSSDWLGQHAQQDKWKLTDREKASKGFRPVHDPLFRAELCLSCHIGNAAENKRITHEMYAAGHPPLSGFEIESFSDKMPRHWRQSYEKQKGEPRFERTRNMLVASVVSMRLSIGLAAVDAGAGDPRWPELARLECYSCHHDLQLPSWRQQRGYTGPVGRPQLDLGCEPLVRVAAMTALGNDGARQADELMKLVQTRIFGKNVFGDPREISALNAEVESWCRKVEARLLTMPFDNKQIIKVFQRVYQIAGRELQDFDTARQLTGAIVTIADELALIYPSKPLPQRLAKIAEEFRKDFFLHIDGESRVENTLHQSLQQRSSHEPADFADDIKSLRRSVEK